MDVEVVIAGGGLAGATAALFSSRHGRSTLCLEAGVGGGQLLSVTRIDDYPGIADAAGFDLVPTLQGQAMDAGVEFRAGEVQALEPAGDRWQVTTPDGEVLAGAVVVATGSRPRRLAVPGEERLEQRGISHCASCDGPIYRGETVVVVGGGDSALHEALELTQHVERIVIVNDAESFTGQEVYRRRVQDSERVAVHHQSVVEEIVGDDAVTGVRIRDLVSGEIHDVPARAVFPCIGSTGNTDFLGGVLELDERGRIWTDASMRTALAGLLAAGDVRAESAAQAVAVAGDGATAAVTADRYLRDGLWPTISLPDVRLTTAR